MFSSFGYLIIHRCCSLLARFFLIRRVKLPEFIILKVKHSELRCEIFFFLPKFFLLAYLLSALLSLTFVAHDSWWIHWQIHLIFFTVVLNLLEVKICKILLRNSRICFFKKIFFAYKACINAYSKEVQMQIE